MRELRQVSVAAALAAALAALLAPGAQAADPILISRASGAQGEKANAPSIDPAMSANGRFVAFESAATNLTADDSDAEPDVFVRDIENGSTTLVSRATGTLGPNADGESRDPSISADGRFVAFSSDATNLDSAATDGTIHVYLRDLRSGSTELVDRADGEFGEGGNDDAGSPSVSADGDSVAFASRALNIHPAAVRRGASQVFVRDRAAETTRLISRAKSGVSGDRFSASPAISGDGETVAFHSFASNLVNGGRRPKGEGIYARELGENENSWVSQPPTGEDDSGFVSLQPAISNNGRWVAFTGPSEQYFPRLRHEAVITRNLDNGAVRAGSTGVRRRGTFVPQDVADIFTAEGGIGLSATGRFVAFAIYFRHEDGGPRRFEAAYVRDQRTGRVVRLPGGVSDRQKNSIGILPLQPTLAANGRWAAFQTERRGLDPADTEADSDIYASRVPRR